MADQGAEGLLSPFLRRMRINAVRCHIRGRILDIGCGSGELSRLVKPDEYFGFDIDLESLCLAKNKFPEYCFTNDEPPQKMKFDTLVSLAVIEHASDPVRFLFRWAKYLDNINSRFVLTTPHPYAEKIHTPGSRIGLFSRQGHEEHQQLIDPQRMEKIAMEAGMQVKIFKPFLFGMNQLFILALLE